MKKLLAILLTLTLLLSTLAFTATAAETNTTTPVSGYSESLIDKLTDTEMAAIPDINTQTAYPNANTKYKITDGAGLQRFTNWVTSNWCTAANNLTFYLANDIVLADYPNLQCGTGYSEFCGTFDGQGNSIKNWSLNVTATSGSDLNGAFFSYVNGTVKNVVFDSSCTVNYTATVFPRGISSLVAFAATDATITNCKSSATVTSTFSNPASTASARGSSKVGGLIGCLNGVTVTVSNLTFDGTISGASGVGGVIGYACGGNVTVKNCVNKGTVTSTSTANTGEGFYRFGTGGIVGLQDSAGALTFNNCLNYGTVTNSRNTASAHSGAMLGIVCQTGAITMTSCNNYGALVSVGTGSGFLGDKYNTPTVTVTDCVDYRTLPQIEGYQTELVEDSDTAQGLRIIASIDSLNYQDVGFNITIKGADGNPVKDKNDNDVVIENYKCKYVYTSLVGMDGDTTVTYSRDTLRPNGYLFAIVIPNIPESLGTITVEVSTFCVTATEDGTAGTTIAGESYTFTHTVGTN